MKYNYEEIMYLTPPQGNLPQPKKILKVVDAFDGNNIKDFKVKSIEGIRWNEATQKLIFDLKGEYI